MVFTRSFEIVAILGLANAGGVEHGLVDVAAELERPDHWHGRMTLDAVLERNYPVVQSTVLAIGVMFMLVNLATDSTASSLDRWGWQNTAYWLSQATTVSFANSGTHTLRIQVREDGVQLDQIVLSPNRFKTSPPGTITNDATIVAK